MARLAALYRLARPGLLPFVLLLPGVGFGWACWSYALDPSLDAVVNLALVVAAWAALNTGTLWLNAALDRDEGEILFGRAVAVPRGISAFAVAALAAAVLLGFAAGLLPGVLAAVCVGLSLLYSAPATAWKGHPIGGPVVNFVGYGLASPLAGWAVVEVPPDVRSVIVLLLGASGVLGIYFAVQAFQRDEDAARGYRTLVVTHGPKGALFAARLCLGLGFAGGTLLAGLGLLPRVCLAFLFVGVWIDRWLAAWSRQPGGGNERWARGLAERLLLGALITITLAYFDYYLDARAGRPPAGQGTRRGAPDPGPLAPPPAPSYNPRG
jgi:4-hydroxybenzoate polyprenyltransferase